MEHICFEVQLCINISMFKEKHVFDILIILCLMTSLPFHMSTNAHNSVVQLTTRVPLRLYIP